MIRRVALKEALDRVPTEATIVIHGNGRFFCDGRWETFGPGDFLFAPAGAEHRFEDFTDDLSVWVLFYGPEGGERKT